MYQYDNHAKKNGNTAPSTSLSTFATYKIHSQFN